MDNIEKAFWEIPASIWDNINDVGLRWVFPLPRCKGLGSPHSLSQAEGPDLFHICPFPLTAHLFLLPSVPFVPLTSGEVPSR